MTRNARKILNRTNFNARVSRSKFGVTVNGDTVRAYTILNQNGMKVTVINYGAIITEICVPDKNGNFNDVVLGYDKLNLYEENPFFFGCVVGPNANRIRNAELIINDKCFSLLQNEGVNNLHSSNYTGYHKRIWSASLLHNGVRFSINDADGSSGFPGNKKASVSYRLTNKNELIIDYEISCDRDTIINPTNHTYFNLAGHDSGNVLHQMIKINASNYLPVDDQLIPTGEICSVSGTPFNFKKQHSIGLRINASDDQLRIGGGYDHNFNIDGYNGKLKPAAVVVSPKTGRVMRVLTDLPGIQFYSGNGLKEGIVGKNNAVYGKHQGFCLETQFYPDAVNHPEFISPIFGSDNPYKSRTVYQFDILQNT